MNLKRIGKLFGLGVALAILALAAGNQGQVGAAQASCTVTLSPGQSIQEAIDRAEEGEVICLAEGTWVENIIIAKGLTLRGAGQDKSIVEGAKKWYPVIRIESDSEIEVSLEGLTIAKSPTGIEIYGKAKVTIKDSTISGNEHDGLHVRDSANVSLTNSTVSGNGFNGLIVWKSANVSLTNSTVSGNGWDGLVVSDSAKVSLQDSTISGNRGTGLIVWDYANVSLVSSTVSGNEEDGLEVGSDANVSLQDSTVSGNRYHGLYVEGSANVSLQDSTVSGNGYHGLYVRESAKVTIKGSTIEKNGTDVHCARANGWICNGIVVVDKSQTTIIDSIIRNNTDWGVAAYLKWCRYDEDYFTGEVIFEGNNVIEGNNTSSNQNGMGNPGTHPFTGLPDGQVCLP